MRREIIQDLSFGSPIAEDEVDSIKSYFVDTDIWNQVKNDRVDLILGEKGAGKSAIFLLLKGNEEEFIKGRGARIVNGENVRGSVVFKSLKSDPVSSEDEIKLIWKVYVLALVARELNSRDIFVSSDSDYVIKYALKSRILYRENADLSRMLRSVRAFVSSIFASVDEVGVSIDPNTGVPWASVKVSAKKKIDADEIVRIDAELSEVLRRANRALEETGSEIWILLDRLDVAFEESEELEVNALRALLRTYTDMRVFQSIKLKLFLRSDIFKKVTIGGFREASHLVRKLNIMWDLSGIVNLIIRRSISNKNLCDFYGVKSSSVVSDFDQQKSLFSKIFPEQVEVGQKKSKTIDWMVKRLSDGRGHFVPRDFIYFVNALIERQKKKFEMGGREPDGDALFDRAEFKNAHEMTSKYKLETFIYAEFPSERKYIEALEYNKSEFNISALSKIWSLPEENAFEVAKKLESIGFFIERKTRLDGLFIVPFLYRPALYLKQGKNLNGQKGA